MNPKKYLRILLAPILQPKRPYELTIRARLSRCMVVYVVATFALAFVVADLMSAYEERSDCAMLVRGKIEEARLQVRQAQETKAKLTDSAKHYAISRCELAAQIILHNPGILAEPESKGLEGLAKQLDLVEIDVVDASGVIEAAFPSEYVGRNYDTTSELREFKRLLTDPSAPIVQDVREDAHDASRRCLYAGVAREDTGGFIEVGLEGNQLEDDVFSLGSIANFVPETTSLFYDNGFFGVYKVDGNALKHVAGSDALLENIKLDNLQEDKAISQKIGGHSYLVYAEQHDGLWYVGAASKKDLSDRSTIFWATVISDFVMIAAIFALITHLIQRVVVRGVYRVNAALTKITAGDLDERVDVKSSKELADLSNGVNSTVDSLKQAIDEVKRKAEDELRVAQKIQAAALPDLDKRYAKSAKFEVYGINRPMHRVGGDMYDFFFVDKSIAFFYVADVSGHGVPAALFMMKAMTLIKNLAIAETDLAEVVSKVNRSLSEANGTLFVTGFFCSIDLRTGVVTYVDAGHNPPFLRRKGDVYKQFEPEINLLLGVEPEAPYAAAEFKLEPGDAFLLYTDGITEATAPEIDCFETSRTLETLNAASEDESAKETVQKLFAAVDKFTNNAEPSDDETVLLFKFKKYAS